MQRTSRVRSCLAFCFALLAFTGCNRLFHSAPSGAFAGGLLGAGTGALIGAAISNGDVAASALLGTAVGIPAGIVTAIMVQKRSEASRRQRLQEEIERNQRSLKATENEIAMRHRELLKRAPKGPTSLKKADPIYTGATLANSYR
jgi:predicted lipid-binding transport protein (Tim44 family)